MTKQLWIPQQFISILLLVAMFALMFGPDSAHAVAPSGMALYQGRQEHLGIAVRLYNQTTPPTTTDSGGHFNLQELDDGTYWLSLAAPLYLSGLIEVTVTDGSVATTSPIVLSGDDLNQDDNN